MLLIASGLQSVVRYVTTDPATGVREQGLARGLTAIALGVFCAVQTRQVISAFPVLTVLYGVVLLVTGLYKTQAVVDMLRLHRPHWGFTALSAGLSLCFAALIFMNPFSTTVALWTFTAITMIAEDLVCVVLSLRRDGGSSRACPFRDFPGTEA